MNPLQSKSEKFATLKALRNAQLAKLREQNVPEQLVSWLACISNPLLNAFVDSVEECPEGNIPFVPVIPISGCSSYWLIQMQENGKDAHVDRQFFFDDIVSRLPIVEPTMPYYMLDVDSKKNVTYDEVPNRSWCSFSEILALNLQTNITKGGVNLHAGASTTSDNECVVYLSTFGGHPFIVWHRRDRMDPARDILPSCRKRVLI